MLRKEDQVYDTIKPHLLICHFTAPCVRHSEILPPCGWRGHRCGWEGGGKSEYSRANRDYGKRKGTVSSARGLVARSKRGCVRGNVRLRSSRSLFIAIQINDELTGFCVFFSVQQCVSFNNLG